MSATETYWTSNLRVRHEYRARLNRLIRREIFSIRLAHATGMSDHEARHRSVLSWLLRERATT